MSERRYSAREWSIAFGAWSGLAALSILQTALYLQQRGQSIGWWSLSINRLADWYTCFAFAPAYVWLIRRYALDQGARLRALPVLLAATVAFVPVKYMLFVPLSRWMLPAGHAPSLKSALVANFFTEMLFLGGIALAIYAFELFRRVQRSQVERARLDGELAEARLDALALQLQPHFLFNTLNSVLALIGRDARAAEDMLTDLSELLQRTLRVEGHEIALGTEKLEQLALYVGIMRRRFDDRLSVCIEVDAAASHALVPKLLLQPIAENAIEHGFAGRGGVGQVTVSASVADSRLRISVRDNGSGFSHAPGDGGGIGLANTRRRLAQMYAGAARFDIEAGDGGTVVSIDIPYRTQAAAQ